jgi:hypothetical protein
MGKATPNTIKKLYAVSSNLCAFPGCRTRLVGKDGKTLVGEVCHIRGDKPDAPRYDASQTDDERQSFENLIVLCPTHHTLVDSDEARYTVAVLQDMKKHHEGKAKEPYLISDELAERIILVMGGAAAALTLEELARRLGRLLGTFAKGLAHSKQEEAGEEPHEVTRREAVEILRYGPKGSFVTYAESPVSLGVASFFATVFKDAGWRHITTGHLIEDELKAARLDAKSFGMGFILKDRHQIANAALTIDEVFAKYGFRIREDGERREMSGPEHGFQGLLLFGEGRQP